MPKIDETKELLSSYGFVLEDHQVHQEDDGEKAYFWHSFIAKYI